VTQQWRLEPSFLIVGAQRCGTTSMFNALAQHPAVVPPLFHKGVHYFDVDFARGARWYRGHFPTRAWAAHRAVAAGRPPVTGESSPYYMHHPLAAGRLAAALPEVRLIVLMRDPIERAWSAYKHESARGYEDQPFEVALDLEPSRLDGEVERLVADPSYRSHSHQHQAYVTRGRYADQIRRLHRHVDADRVLLVESERFFADPAPTYLSVLDFLGLPRWTPPSFPQMNSRPGAAMATSTRRWLTQQFEEPDAQLAELLGSAPAWRQA